MALVYDPVVAASFFVTYVDESGNTSTKQYVVDPASWEPVAGLWADLVAIRAALIADINNVTHAAIKSIHTTIVQIEDTVPPSSVADVGSEVENLASLSLNLTTAGKFAVVQIPAAEIGIFLGPNGPDKNVVDKNDANLLAFLDNFATGTGDFTLSDGEKIDAATPIKSGKRIHRRSTKG